MRDRRAHLLARAKLLSADAAELAGAGLWTHRRAQLHHALMCRSIAATQLAHGHLSMARVWLASARRNEKEANYV